MISISIHSHLKIRSFYPRNGWQVTLVTGEGVELTIFNDKPLALFALAHFDPSPEGFACHTGDSGTMLRTQDAARYYASLLETGYDPEDAATDAHAWETSRKTDEELLEAFSDRNAVVPAEDFTTEEQLSEAREAEHEAEPTGTAPWSADDELRDRPKGPWNIHTLK